MNPATTTTIDRQTFTITFLRTFSSPPERVFDAWTQPDQVRQWWDPTGAELAECTIDLRPGGAFRFVHRDGGHGPPFAGVYRVVNRPSELVFEAMGALGTVALTTRDGATHMTVSIRCASEAHLQQFVALGVAEGTARTLDNLVALVR